MREVRWPNVERVAIAWLGAFFEPRAPGVSIYSEIAQGDDATKRGDHLTVERVGGGSVWISKDVDVEVAVHASQRARMWDLVAVVEAAMYYLAANGDPLGDPPFYVDDVTESFGFRYDPHPNQSLRRAIATYTLTVRPTRAHDVTAGRP